MKPSANCSGAAVEKKWPQHSLLWQEKGNDSGWKLSFSSGFIYSWVIKQIRANSISYRDEWRAGLQLWAQPMHTRGIHVRSFMTAELRCSPCLIENCPQMSKIKQPNKGETLTINMVMGVDVFIKLKCKMQGKLKNRGWERNMLFWSSSLRRLEWYLLEKQSFHLPQTHKRIWQDEKCTYIIHRWLKPSIQFRPSMPCQKWAILRKQFGSCVSASKKGSGLTQARTHTPTPTCTSGVWISVTLFLINGDNSAPYTLLWHVAPFFILSYRPIGCKLSMVCVLA